MTGPVIQYNNKLIVCGRKFMEHAVNDRLANERASYWAMHRLANRDWIKDEMERAHGPLEDWPVPPKFYAEHDPYTPDGLTERETVAVAACMGIVFCVLVFGSGILVGHFLW